MARIALLVAMIGASAGAQGASQPGPGDYLLDFARPVIEKHFCAGCPGYIAQMIGAVPKRLKDIADKNEVLVEDCHATLIAPDVVITASHCMRRWTGPSQWQAMAHGDCSQAYSFFFPATDREPQVEVRCGEILTPIALNSGAPQLEPDDVLVRLAQKVGRQPAPTAQSPILTAETVDLWGYEGEAAGFVHRTCHRITGSVLTPLDRTGEGAYATLTCDGPVTAGCSGGGAFIDGIFRGLISCGARDTGFGYGLDQVVISEAYCATIGPLPPPARCFVTAQRRDAALHDLYLSAIDKSERWLEQTRNLLEQKFPYARFAYVHGVPTLPPFTYTPGYAVECFYADRLPTEGRIVVDAPFDLTTFRPQFVTFNADTTVRGVIERSNPGEELREEFSIGFNFRWATMPEAGMRGLPHCG